MTEMRHLTWTPSKLGARSAAEALQEEATSSIHALGAWQVRITRPNLDVSQKAPSSAATSTGPPPHGSEEMDSEGGWAAGLISWDVGPS